MLSHFEDKSSIARSRSLCQEMNHFLPFPSPVRRQKLRGSTRVKQSVDLNGYAHMPDPKGPLRVQERLFRRGRTGLSCSGLGCNSLNYLWSVFRVQPAASPEPGRGWPQLSTPPPIKMEIDINKRTFQDRNLFFP